MSQSSSATSITAGSQQQSMMSVEEELKTLDIEQTIDWIEHQGVELDESDKAIFKKEKIKGRHLIGATGEKLVNFYKLPAGTADDLLKILPSNTDRKPAEKRPLSGDISFQTPPPKIARNLYSSPLHIQAIEGHNHADAYLDKLLFSFYGKTSTIKDFLQLTLPLEWKETDQGPVEKYPIFAGKNFRSPYLIVDRLPAPSDTIRPLTKMADLIGRMESFLVLYGPFGSGKTRTILEVCCFLFCLFFVAAKAGNGGSEDLVELYSTLRQCNLSSNFPNENKLYVSRLTHALILSRLIIFLELKNRCADLSARDWLLIQLNPTMFLGYDVFKEKFKECAQLADPIFELNRAIEQVKQLLELKTQFPLFIDEAQVLVDLYRGFFPAETPRGQRSVLSAMVKAIPEDFSVCVAGTSLALDQVKEDLGTPVFKLVKQTGDSINWDIFTFSDFIQYKNSNEAWEGYAKVYMKPEDETDFKNEIYPWIKGRHRFLAQFCQEYLANGADWKTSLSKIYQQTTVESRNNKSSLFYLFYSWYSGNKQEKERLEELIDLATSSNVWNSNSIVKITPTQKVLAEAGFFRLFQDSSSVKFAFDEPLIRHTFLNLLMELDELIETLSQLILSFKELKSSQGFIFERIVAAVMIKVFKNPPILEWNKIKLDKWRVFIPVFTDLKLFGYPGDQNFEDYLNSPRSVVYFPENIAGPDVVFFLINTETGELKVVFFQVKFQTVVKDSYVELRATVTPETFYTKRAQRKGEVLEEESEGEEAEGQPAKRATILRILQDKKLGFIPVVFAFPDEFPKPPKRVQDCIFIGKSNCDVFLTQKQQAILIEAKK